MSNIMEKQTIKWAFNLFSSCSIIPSFLFSLINFSFFFEGKKKGKIAMQIRSSPGKESFLKSRYIYRSQKFRRWRWRLMCLGKCFVDLKLNSLCLSSSRLQANKLESERQESRLLYCTFPVRAHLCSQRLWSCVYDGPQVTLNRPNSYKSVPQEKEEWK